MTGATGAPRAVTPFVDRLRELAAQDPDRPALVDAGPPGGPERVLTRAELVDAVDRATVVLRDEGVRPRSRVAVCLPNGAEHVLACAAVWASGGCVLPVNPAAPAPEREALLAVFDPDVVVEATSRLGERLAAVPADRAAAAARLAVPVADPGKAVGTGGSTGRPKVVVTPGPWGHDPGVLELLGGFGFAPDQVQLVPGPLHHNFGFDWAYQGLMAGHTVVLLRRFDAAEAVRLIARHAVTYVGLVPTMMRRVVQLPDLRREDLSSLEAVLHTGGPCPAWVKHAWIDLVGATRVIEAYGASEGFGNTVIRGEEWLERPGSVGRAFRCELVLLDPAGEPVPTGETGEVFMRRPGVGDRYLGAQARLRPDGFGSVGDLGTLDADGYLYLADRAADLVVTGGANVYPAEVEAALSEHPAVADVAVVGLPDDEWGHRVHAVVQPYPGAEPPTEDDLTRHCRERVAPYKVPRSYEFVAALPRDEGGKLRRNQLAAERRAGAR